MTTLKVNTLSVYAGRKQILKDVTLPPISTGKLTALIGPNGAGKSTLLKAFAQIVPSSGDLIFAAHDLRALSGRERAQRVGFMPQVLPTATELTAIECVIVALQAAGAPTPERRALSIMSELDILNLALQPIDRLSGGERQLVALAQAVASGPELILLDEPTSALDLARQFQVMRHVRKLAGGGAAVVAVLHDLSLAAQWADEVIVLSAGRFHQAGSPLDVIKPAMLAEVYGLDARVVTSADGLLIVPEGLSELHAGHSS